MQDYSIPSSIAVGVAYLYPYAQVIWLRWSPGNEASPAAGLALILLAAGLSLVSLLTMGRLFGVRPALRGLVTRGPYKLVRHPVYLGELGACAGLVMGAATTWNLTAVGVLLVAQLVRMRLEERALEREFPEYAAYAAHTPRIVPWPGRLRPMEV